MGAKKSSPRKIVAVICGIFLLYAAAGCLFALAARDSQNAAYEIFRSKVIIAERSAGKERILLSGGSNAIWGYRSAIFERELGRPTINLALSGEGGETQLMRELAVEVAQPGDTVVYSSISFWNSYDPHPHDAEAFRQTAGMQKSGGSSGVFKDLFSSVSRLWQPLPRGRSLAADLPFLYRRYILLERSEHFDPYNEQGDIKSCKKGSPAPWPFKPLSPNLDFVQEMEIFRDQLSKKGARLVVDIPWARILPHEKAQWQETYQPLLSRLQGRVLTTLSSLEETMHFEEELFCDTPHHLSDEAALDRSRRTSAALRQLLDQDHAAFDLVKLPLHTGGEG